MYRIFFFAVVVIASGVMGARFFEETARLVVRPNSMVATSSSATRPEATGQSRSVVLNPDRGGHFQVEARVDGWPVDLVVDTGASLIALRESEAARLGIRPSAADYKVKVSTANGVGRAALVELHAVDINGIVVRDVKALVHPDASLSVNLLGMSFLSRVRWTHDRGKLVLEQ
jgi:aspartyl protease family protein